MKNESAIARILKIPEGKEPEDGVPEGAGVLVGDRLVLTCAHVVKQVIRNLDGPVYLDFPLSPERVRSGRKWVGISVPKAA